MKISGGKMRPKGGGKIVVRTRSGTSTWLRSPHVSCKVQGARCKVQGARWLLSLSVQGTTLSPTTSVRPALSCPRAGPSSLSSQWSSSTEPDTSSPCWLSSSNSSISIWATRRQSLTSLRSPAGGDYYFNIKLCQNSLLEIRLCLLKHLINIKLNG